MNRSAAHSGSEPPFDCLTRAAWQGREISSAARLAAPLGRFEPISLAELAGIALMDRLDTKYLLKRSLRQIARLQQGIAL